MIFLNIIFFLYCLIETVISDNNDSNSTDDNLLEKLKLEKHLNTILQLIKFANKTRISSECIHDLTDYYHNNRPNLKKNI